MEDSGWAVSGTRLLWSSLGSSWSWWKEFEHVFTTTVVIALHKGRISHTFRALAHTTAKIHSPEALSSIRSQGLGLEHGRIAQRSLSPQKEMSMCPAAALGASTIPGTSPAELMARRPAPQLLHHTKTSRTHPLHPAREPTLHSASSTLRSQDLRHGTSHRPSRCLKNSVSRPVASIVSPYDLRKGIDR